ncbi:hypothetical protein OIV83_002439 [Microbotryomycetes sp. JL201]|nr:hypothetical protein OIV83_002439 [Microbotryomycetes sp. JL201]
MSFEGAPVTRGLIVAVCGVSIAAAVVSRQYLFDVPLVPHLTRDHQLWRLALHHLAFTNSSDLFVSVLLLYYTSVPVERNFGSHKFASFLVVIAGLSTTLELVALLLGFRLGFTSIPAGPFAIVFAIIFQSTRQVPTLFYWKLFGVEVTNRIARYILLVQASRLLASNPPATLIVASIGAVASQMYLSNFLQLRRYRISSRTTDLLVRILQPLSPSGSSHVQRGTFATQQDALSASPAVTVSNGGLLMRSAWMGRAAGQQPQVPSQVNATPNDSVTPSRQAATPATAATAPGVPGATPGQTPVAPPGFMQQWAAGLGRQQIPTAQQVSELSSIFPDTPRDSIVAALQRNGLDVGRAAESLLTS